MTIAVGIILTSVIGAVVTAIGSEARISQSDAQAEAGTLGVAAAAVLAVAYYTGGYVAGRMSRFDGAKQGIAVWASACWSRWSRSGSVRPSERSTTSSTG